MLIMKNIFKFIFVLVLFTSCKSEIETSKTPEIMYNENPIIGKWKLQIHQKKEATKTEVNLKAQPTIVILNVFDGGYFVIYDTFVDPKFNQKGFNRIYERSKGQWEYDDNEKLTLHHNFEDTSYVEELIVTTLNKNTLVTKSKDKKATIYKTYEGY